MKAQPTLDAATPLFVRPAYNTATIEHESNGLRSVVAKMDDYQICSEHGGIEQYSALIVRAVNSHAVLVAALEDAEFLMRQASKHAGSMQDSFKRSAEDARAALALARGNQ
jgi:hypothetical protein